MSDSLFIYAMILFTMNLAVYLRIGSLKVESLISYIWVYCACYYLNRTAIINTV
jgi:hypothetical protein